MATASALEREALEWVARQLRWERTLAQLRAAESGLDTERVDEERKAA